MNRMNKELNPNFKNFDKKEIIRFNKSAYQWWYTDGIFKSLHCINAIRLKYILKYSNGLFGKSVLDVGCGGGLLSESMAKEGATVVGLDISSYSIEVAKSHASSQNLTINYILETIEEHSLRHQDYYDVVTCMELLEHVPNPVSVIHACASIVKSGGSVFFSTLNRTYKAWLLVILGAEYIFSFIPKGTHKFKKFITPSELLNWMDTTYLKEKNISGIYYNPITNTCMITSNLDINYILHTERC